MTSKALFVFLLILRYKADFHLFSVLNINSKIIFSFHKNFIILIINHLVFDILILNFVKLRFGL
jgi:hypothetical protein